MTTETLSVLNKLRLEFLANAEKDYGHCRTLHPGGAKRIAMQGSAQGWERAARLVENKIIEYATTSQNQ